MNLYQARKAKGWTLTQVADLIGAKSPMTVWRHERGYNAPRAKIRARYAAIYAGMLDESAVRDNYRRKKP